MRQRKTKLCIHCSCVMPFSTTNHSKFCSNSCKENYRSLQEEIKKDKAESKNCAQCSASFKTAHAHQVCCSKECQIERTRIALLNRNGMYSDFSIYHRDKFSCVYCGKNSIQDGIKLHIDHIVPLSKGGLTVLDNLITSCEKCNLSKSDHSLSPDCEEMVMDELYKRNHILSVENTNLILNQIDYLTSLDKARNEKRENKL